MNSYMKTLLREDFLQQDWVKNQPKPFQTQALEWFEKRLQGEIEFIDYFGEPMIYSPRDALFYSVKNGHPEKAGTHKSENDLERLSKEAFNQRFQDLWNQLENTFSQKANIENQLKLLLSPDDIEKWFFHSLESFPDAEKIYITRAFELCKAKHHRQLRDEGTPYYTHPVFVAIKWIEMGRDARDTIVLLLHDTLEDTDLSYEEIKEWFWEYVATQVRGLSKKENWVNIISKADYYASIEKDASLATLKGLDRLGNLFSLNFASSEKKQKYLKETKEIILPIVAIYDTKLAEELLKCVQYLENETFPLPEELIRKLREIQEINRIQDELKLKS